MKYGEFVCYSFMSPCRMEKTFKKIYYEGFIFQKAGLLTGEPNYPHNDVKKEIDRFVSKNMY